MNKWFLVAGIITGMFLLSRKSAPAISASSPDISKWLTSAQLNELMASGDQEAAANAALNMAAGIEQYVNAPAGQQQIPTAWLME